MTHRDGSDDRENQAAPVGNAAEQPADGRSEDGDLPAVVPKARTGSDVHTRPDTPLERVGKRPASRPASMREKKAGPPGDQRIGETLVGRYRVEELIGKGGMGRVYQATQFPLNRSVAVKVLNPDFQQKDPQFVRRFFLEAATAARLNHPNTITIFDYGETDRGELFIAMEHLRGRPLSRVIAMDGPLSAERTLHIAMQIARALREAHAKGIIHRDLKPGNIMILEEGDDANFAKVLDFGLVKLFSPPKTEGSEPAVVEQLTPSPLDGEMTRAGMFLGSPKYMSPEQIQARELDPRTDIYSLGVIMFQMLVGRVPFRGGSSVEILYKHVNHPVPAIHDMNPEADAPPELERIVERCLRKNVDERVPSMATLLTEMKKVRHALTGIGSVSSSLGSLDVIHLSDSSESYPPQEPFPLSSSSAPPSSPDPVPFVDRDAALDDTSAPPAPPSAPVPPALRMKHPRPFRQIAPYLVGFGTLLGLGIAGFQLTSSTKRSPTTIPSNPVLIPAPDPAPPAPTAQTAEPQPSLAKVTFDSRPTGAEVFEGEQRLGMTPFEKDLPVGADQKEPRSFVFKKPGYVDSTVEQTLDGDRVQIVTSLQPTKAQEAPRTGRRRSGRRIRKPRGERNKRKGRVPSEYKENPY
jgi:serine/threonine-protein kinase